MFCSTVSAVYPVPFVALQGGLYEGTGAPVAGARAAGCDIRHVGNFFPHWRLIVKPREPDSGYRIGPKADTETGT